MVWQKLPEVLNIGLRVSIFTDLQKKIYRKCPIPCRDNEIAYVFSDDEVLICTQTLIYRIIKNDCRGFNNLPYTIHLG